MAAETPQQLDFLKYYTDPKSETFSNALQSALRAGYSQEYSENITSLMPDWLSDSIGRRKRLLEKAERALEETLDMPVEVLEWEGYGEDKEQVVNTSPALVKIKQDTAKFIASTVGKENYSNRTELTGKDGKDLIPEPILGGKSNVQSNNSDTEDSQSE